MTEPALAQVHDYQCHPVAELFPLMEGRAFNALVEDIRGNGLIEPIILLNGTILDGRNRFRACRAANVVPVAIEWQGPGDPLAFVISKNLLRRQLTMSQRALIAGGMMNMRRQDTLIPDAAHRKLEVKINTSSDRNEKISAQEAADRMQVSRPHAFHGRKVLEGTAEEIASVRRGDKAVSTIATIIRKRQKEAKQQSARTAEIVQLHPRKRGYRVGPVLPTGVTPEEIARRAAAMRNAGKSVNETADELKIARRACADMIDIVLIADRTDLSPRDAATAARALQQMNAGTVRLPDIHAAIAPIAARLWGAGKAVEGRQGSRPEREAQRLDRFERGLGVLVQACTNGARIEVPHLSPQRAAEIQAELKGAITDIKTLLGKIGSIHQ